MRVAAARACPLPCPPARAARPPARAASQVGQGATPDEGQGPPLGERGKGPDRHHGAGIRVTPCTGTGIDLARKEVAALRIPQYSYSSEVIRELQAGTGTVVRLQSNESPVPPPNHVLAALRTVDINRYPDATCYDLRAALCARLGVAVDRITIGCGSEQLIRSTGDAFMSPSAVAIVPGPSFPVYATALSLAGCPSITVPVTSAGAADCDAMASAAVKAARAGKTVILFLPSINNPTGGAVAVGAIRSLAHRLPPRCLLVVDDAYAEYSEGADALAELQSCDATCPWLLLRSFSKAWGLAGARVGYAVASSTAVSAGLERTRGVFFVNAYAQAVALAALADDAYMRTSVKDVLMERSRLAGEIESKLSLRVRESAASWILIYMADAKAVANRLQSHGVLVIASNELQGGPCLRCSVGSRFDSGRFVDALTSALESLR